MDACIKLPSQSNSKEDIQLIHAQAELERAGDVLQGQNMDDVKPSLFSDEQAQFVDQPLKQILTPCPTLTPQNGHPNDFIYSKTPHTSPPQPTPPKAILSENELTSIARTSSMISSSSADFIPISKSELVYPASANSIQTALSSNIDPLELRTEIHTVMESPQTSKGFPQGLLSPVKIPLHASNTLNDSPKANHLDTRSKTSSLKRIHAEIENIPSTASIKSPKKARITTPGCSTPDVNDSRRSRVSQPFRPFSILKKESCESYPATNLNSPQTPTTASSPGGSDLSELKPFSNGSSQKILHSKMRNTSAVSKPFKSPFKSPLSSLSSVTNKSATSPNIRALEQKVVMLKRAIKVLSSNEDEKLNILIKKWTLAGREVAWELWSIMKDRNPQDAMMYDDKEDRFNNNWNWTVRRNWGWDDRTESCPDGDNPANSPVPSQLEAEMWNSINDRNTMKRQEAKSNNGSAHTLGTMLRSYGVADDILGWNNDEEDFVELV